MLLTAKLQRVRTTSVAGKFIVFPLSPIICVLFVFCESGCIKVFCNFETWPVSSHLVLASKLASNWCLLLLSFNESDCWLCIKIQTVIATNQRGITSQYISQSGQQSSHFFCRLLSDGPLFQFIFRQLKEKAAIRRFKIHCNFIPNTCWLKYISTQLSVMQTSAVHACFSGNKFHKQVCTGSRDMLRQKGKVTSHIPHPLCFCPSSYVVLGSPLNPWHAPVNPLSVVIRESKT